MQDVYFWQNMPSHIQAPALRELCARWPGNVHGVWCDPIADDRREMGWLDPDLGSMQQTHLATERPHEHAREIIDGSRNAIHVFSGLHAYGPIVTAHQHAVSLDADKLALMVEPGIPLGWKGRLRPIRAKYIARKYRNTVRLVLAMGLHGVDFYTKAGFRPEIVFPFMYQAEPASVVSDDSVGAPVRLVYVGKFIPRKGVDIMLKALARCQQSSWRLTIVGDGPNRSGMLALAQELGINDSIDWRGAQPSSDIPQILATHDLCLIPSRFEGWGVVSNEALQAGIGVLCSDSVTSRDLVLASGAGETFRNASPKSFAGLIDEWVSSPPKIEAAKIAARAYRSRLSPETAGQYLADVLSYTFQNGPRPSTPWLDQVGH